MTMLSWAKLHKVKKNIQQVAIIFMGVFFVFIFFKLKEYTIYKKITTVQWLLCITIFSLILIKIKKISAR
jgi:cell division protein FtsW (lipid II flippase)